MKASKPDPASVLPKELLDELAMMVVRVATGKVSVTQVELEMTHPKGKTVLHISVASPSAAETMQRALLLLQASLTS